MVTPCTNALRALQSNINKHLGNDMGMKHANAQLDADIRCLMDSLRDHQVYVQVPGRIIKYEDAEVEDVIDVGMSQLASLSPTSPLAEYNAAFRRLQKRRQMAPITKPPSPTFNLNATELPAMAESVFPRTPSPPSSPGTPPLPTALPGGQSSPPISSHEPIPNPESSTQHSAHSEELLDEIGEVKDDLDPGEPLLQGELQRMMDDVESGVEDATLARESLRDVALDMDAVESEDEDDLESDSSGSDSDYNP